MVKLPIEMTFLKIVLEMAAKINLSVLYFFISIAGRQIPLKLLTLNFAQLPTEVFQVGQAI
jgi:hypothetical protein